MLLHLPCHYAATIYAAIAAARQPEDTLLTTLLISRRCHYCRIYVTMHIDYAPFLLIFLRAIFSCCLRAFDIDAAA